MLLHIAELNLYMYFDWEFSESGLPITDTSTCWSIGQIVSLVGCHAAALLLVTVLSCTMDVNVKMLHLGCVLLRFAKLYKAISHIETGPAFVVFRSCKG